MKSIFHKALLALVAVLFLVIHPVKAQDIRNQTEQLKTLKTGRYFPFEVKQNKNGTYDCLDLEGEHELLEINPEPNFSEHKYFKMKMYGTDENFIPDNMAFPITYAKLFYEGNDQLKEQVGYVPREIRPGSTNRVCVVDGIIFDLNTKFKADDPETHIPYRLYVHETYGEDFDEEDAKEVAKKNKKRSLKERMEYAMMKKIANSNPELKVRFNCMQKLQAVGAVDLVREYLAAAIKEQKAMEPKWKQDANNIKRVELLDERRALMLAATKKYNEDLMDKPEWRRIQENNAYWDKHAKANDVTIVNGTDRDIYLYESGSMNGTRINAGSSSKFSCKTTYYYAFDGNSGTRGGNAGPLAYTANSSCGGSVTVN
ncbi:MAG: hypothetical protein AAGF77_07250 [Bacteroidota bacterium]